MICKNSNKTTSKFIFAAAVLMSMTFMSTSAFAAEKRIPDGITVGDIEAGGMTEQELMAKANEYVQTFTGQNITLDVDGNQVGTTAGDLGYYWKNTDIVSKASSYCQEGNVICRYKESKDISHNGGVKYDFEMDVNDETMRNTINAVAKKYNVPHVNASLSRSGSGFSISPESTGRVVDVEAAVSSIHNYLNNDWDGKPWTDKLTVVVDQPTCTTTDCAQVKDLIGSFSTKFSTSGANSSRNKNLENGMRLLNGITIPVGETISVNSYLEPWTASNGWHAGGTYVNGKVEDTLGGGICQVSTTLYNAALNAELEIVERYNHSMTVGYVPLSMDAALAGTWKDLKLKNNTNTPVYIEGIYSSGTLTFNIYGVETRPAGRSVQYVSQKSGSSSGYGYKLVKKVFMNGALQSETVVNTSTYKDGSGHTGSRNANTGSAVVTQPEETTTAQPETQPQTTSPQETTTPQPETTAAVSEPQTQAATEPSAQDPNTTATNQPAAQ